MGYTTNFNGTFKLDKPLTVVQAKYLSLFSETRRMARDAKKVLSLKGKDRNNVCFDLLEKLGMNVGENGQYYCGVGDFGQNHDPSITNRNSGGDQPGLWCQWIPTVDRKGIKWDGNEKFYSYVEWIEYIIDHFLSRWGRTLSGMVAYQGEENDDRGRIVIVDNHVLTFDESQFLTLSRLIPDVYYGDAIPYDYWEDEGEEYHCNGVDDVTDEESGKVIGWFRDRKNLSVALGISNELDAYIEHKLKEKAA